MITLKQIRSLNILISIVFTGVMTGANAQIFSFSENQKLDIRFELLAKEKKFEQWDAIPFVLTVKNVGYNITIWEPKIVHRTILFEIIRNDLPFSLQRRWSGIPMPKKILLKSNEMKEFIIELSWLFPINFPEGSYKLNSKIRLTPEWTVDLDLVFFTVDLINDQRQKEFVSYKASIRGGEHQDVVDMGSKFLDDFPTSPYANRLRMEYAFALSKIGDHNEAINQYTVVEDAINEPNWRRREAKFRLAWEYYYKNNIRTAIQIMRTLETQTALSWANDWQDKLELQNTNSNATSGKDVMDTELFNSKKDNDLLDASVADKTVNAVSSIGDNRTSRGNSIDSVSTHYVLIVLFLILVVVVIRVVYFKKNNMFRKKI